MRMLYYVAVDSVTFFADLIRQQGCLLCTHMNVAFPVVLVSGCMHVPSTCYAQLYVDLYFIENGTDTPKLPVYPSVCLVMYM